MTTVTRTPGEGRKRLEAALRQLKDVSAQVGWLFSAKYPDGMPVAYIATIHEYGYAPKNIPPRMGLRAMIPTKQESWARWAERGAKMVLDGSGTVIDAMTGIGVAAEGDIRKQIASVKEPALKPATLTNRARALGLSSASDLTGTGAKPLVEPARKDGGAGLLIASVTFVVNQDGAIIQ